MADRPNVLILHTDQQRYDCLGCSGNPFVVTPNIDRLADGGCVLTRHIAANPVCMPSRASLLTGLYPQGHNVWANGVPLPRTRIEMEEAALEHSPAPIETVVPTIADMFAGAGYRTASFGKLHLTPNLAPAEMGYEESWCTWATGRLNDWHGPYYGFQYVDMTKGHGEQPCGDGHYALWLREQDPQLSARLQRGEIHGHKPIPELGCLYPSLVPAELHNNAWLARRFEDYLERRGDDEAPFFSFVGFPDPHHPFTPSHDVVAAFADVEVKMPVDPEGAGVMDSPFWGPRRRRGAILGGDPEKIRTVIRYTYAMLKQVDDAVGRIVDSLRKRGLLDNTIIFFTSDHGDFLGDHGMLFKGVAAANSLLHVPGILRAPGADLPPRLDAVVSNCDVMPTLAELAGIDLPAPVHGRPLSAILGARETARAGAFCFDGNPALVNHTLYDNHYRYTNYPAAGVEELFDHREDPGEARNVAADRPTVVRAMREELHACFMATTNPLQARYGAW